MISSDFRVFLKYVIDWELSQSEIIASEKMRHFLFTAVEKLGIVVLEIVYEFILALNMEVYFDNTDDSC